MQKTKNIYSINDEIVKINNWKTLLKNHEICFFLIRRKIYLLLSGCWQLLFESNLQNVHWLWIFLHWHNRWKYQNVSFVQSLKSLWSSLELVRSFSRELSEKLFENELLHVRNRIKTQERRISFSNEFSSCVGVRNSCWHKSRGKRVEQWHCDCLIKINFVKNEY